MSDLFRCALCPLLFLVACVQEYPMCPVPDVFPECIEVLSSSYIGPNDIGGDFFEIAWKGVVRSDCDSSDVCLWFYLYDEQGYEIIRGGKCTTLIIGIQTVSGRMWLTAERAERVYRGKLEIQKL